MKMRAELARLNHCAVPFLSRAAVNLCWYYYTIYKYKQAHTFEMNTPIITVLNPENILTK